MGGQNVTVIGTVGAPEMLPNLFEAVDRGARVAPLPEDAPS